MSVRLTPEQWRGLRLAVFELDGWECVARKLDVENHPVCHTQWGQPFTEVPVRNLRRVDQYLTLDHVLDNYGGMALRAPHDTRHLVTQCWGSHLGAGPHAGYRWATDRENRIKVRDYLAKRYADGRTPREVIGG